MENNFDFGLDTSGELIIDSNSHDIMAVTDDNLRLQLAYNRIASVMGEWFLDNDVGANLEELIGRACNEENAEVGKQRIINALTFDQLWELEDIFVRPELVNNINITYSIYLRTYQGIDEDTIVTHELQASLDLIKGVHIRYGWEPRR